MYVSQPPLACYQNRRAHLRVRSLWLPGVGSEPRWHWWGRHVWWWRIICVHGVLGHLGQRRRLIRRSWCRGWQLRRFGLLTLLPESSLALPLGLLRQKHVSCLLWGRLAFWS